MGLLDLPGPLLGWIDGLLSGVPPLVRLVLWGLAAGALSMWLYKVISPQARIARSKHEQLEARRQLDSFDGELSDAWPLIRRLLGLSLGHVGRVIGPALIAALPVVCVLVWMSSAYGYVFPDRPPPVTVRPPPLEAGWSSPERGPPLVLVSQPGGGTIGRIPLPAPVPVIEKWHWWNVLVGNPAGYLDDETPAERIEISLPRQQFVDAGPGWVRGWELPFFVSVLVVSLALKRALQIH